MYYSSIRFCCFKTLLICIQICALIPSAVTNMKTRGKLHKNTKKYPQTLRCNKLTETTSPAKYVLVVHFVVLKTLLVCVQICALIRSAVMNTTIQPRTLTSWVECLQARYLHKYSEACFRRRNTHSTNEHPRRYKYLHMKAAT